MRRKEAGRANLLWSMEKYVTCMYEGWNGRGNEEAQIVEASMLQYVKYHLEILLNILLISVHKLQRCFIASMLIVSV